MAISYYYMNGGYKNNKNNEFKITKREILFSSIIITIMLLIGIVIHGNINEKIMLEQQKYNTALQIENDSDLFSYGMKTNIGNSFVYGELKAVDTVTYPEIGGEYMYVEKVKERYTMHTRTVTTTVNGKTSTRTETYWTWDRVGSEDIKCTEIEFCGITFNSNKIQFPSSYYIDTIKESSHIRYKYYGVSAKHIGTIFAELKDETIPDGTKFYEDMSIEDTLENLKSNLKLVLFWIMWILLIAGCVFGFYYIDNKWLEDKKTSK